VSARLRWFRTQRLASRSKLRGPNGPGDVTAQACTFAPALNERSLRLAAAEPDAALPRHERLTRLAEVQAHKRAQARVRATLESLRECSFHPKTAATAASAAAAAVAEHQATGLARALQLHTLHRHRLDRLRMTAEEEARRREQEETKECTFAPDTTLSAAGAPDRLRRSPGAQAGDADAASHEEGEGEGEGEGEEPAGYAEHRERMFRALERREALRRAHEQLGAVPQAALGAKARDGLTVVQPFHLAVDRRGAERVRSMHVNQAVHEAKRHAAAPPPLRRPTPVPPPVPAPAPASATATTTTSTTHAPARSQDDAPLVYVDLELDPDAGPDRIPLFAHSDLHAIARAVASKHHLPPEAQHRLHLLLERQRAQASS
jgi:hypothetical protein